MMPKRGRKFISEFLIPNLDQEKYGKRLRWLSREHLLFQIQWSHKSASVWTESDCQVFMDWDKKQGHFRPLDKDYFPKSKQRFRAVLNKLIKDREITPFISNDKKAKIYCFGNGDNILKTFQNSTKTTKDNKLSDYMNNKLLDDLSSLDGSCSETLLEKDDTVKNDALESLIYLPNKVKELSGTVYNTYFLSPNDELSLYSTVENSKGCPEIVGEDRTVHINILEETMDLNHDGYQYTALNTNLENELANNTDSENYLHPWRLIG